MKFSIITINLNNVNGLKQTINSILSQSYKDFEYIVIDGGSTDGSKELIGYYSDRFTYWKSEKDNGIYQAMNKGIRIASGEYILFLNSGDYLIDNEVLEVVANVEMKEDIVVGDCDISKNGLFKFKATSPEQITFKTFYRSTIPHQATFIRRILFDRLGGYNEKYRIHADLDFFIKAIILNNCSYKHLAITISNYNLEGFSSNPENKSISENEYDSIVNSLIAPRILADYFDWNKEHCENEVLFWAKSKSLLYKPLSWAYLTVGAFNRLKKKQN